MPLLARPTDDPSNVFVTCVSNVRANAIRQKFLAAAPLIGAAAASFLQAAENHSLHTMAIQNGVGADISTDEMINIYDQRMARKKSPGRAIYDKLMIAPPYGRCPLCGQGRVKSLDHHLPKTHFPALAVTPVNLVPACTDCNRAKGEIYPLEAAQQILHPYFDDLDTDVWLKGTLVQTAPAAISFAAQPPVGWPELTKARVRSHFRLLKLGEMYTAYAADELQGIKKYLQKLHAKSGAADVKNHLEEQAESRADDNKNSWQAATYRELAISDWFCDGGFN